MSKKKPTIKKGAASFEVRFVGGDVRPETVPIGLVSEALTAIQDIVAGRDSFNDSSTSIPKDKSINLVDVKRGSAVYSIFSPEPEPAIQNLMDLGSLVENTSKNLDSLVSSLNPIEKLSRIARVIGCLVKVNVAGDRKNSILEIAGDDYDRLAKDLFVHGDSTLIGSIERVGGVTDMRCVARVVNRRKLLYCNVESRELLQQLGQNLYEKVALKGEATWVHSNWYVHKFKITGFSKPIAGETKAMIGKLRDSGMDAWDNVSDIESAIQGLR